MAQKGEWTTAPADGNDGKRVIVTGRRDVERFRQNPRMTVRVEVSWPYAGDAEGLPDDTTSMLMEQVTDTLLDTFNRDPVAVMTGIYTGEGERTFIFYTVSTHIFGRKLNEALAGFPLLPLKIYCENDPEWAEYDEMTLVFPPEP